MTTQEAVNNVLSSEMRESMVSEPIISQGTPNEDEMKEPENIIIQNVTMTPRPYEPPSQTEMSTLQLLEKLPAKKIKKSRNWVMNSTQTNEHFNQKLISKSRTFIPLKPKKMKRNASGLSSKKEDHHEIYYKDTFNLSREMINQTAVAAKLRNEGSPWKSILKNLQQNPEKVMKIIPSPRKIVSK
jgi:hypothetical protein